jgi:signal transduction histidine kinase
VSPRSLKWQAALVVAGALLLSHLVGVTVYHFDRKETLATSETLDLAERVLGYVMIAEPLGAGERRRILGAAKSRFLEVSFAGRDTFPSTICPGSPVLESVRALIAETLPPEFGWHACVDDAPRAAAPESVGASHSGGKAMTVAIRFPDSEVVRFRGLVPEASSFLSDVADISYIVAATLLVAAAAYWVIQRVTLPLQRFGEKATEIGKNLDAPPLPEEGPSEVVAAAKAFNRMQDRLNRLIGSRTEMLAAISHDLRTPITRLRLRVEMLDDEHERGKLLSVLGEMESMVKSVLEFIRGAAPREQPRIVDVCALAESLCADAAEDGAPVTFVGDMRPINLSCRPAALRRALQNVIDNSVKHAGGAEVAVESAEAAVTIRVRDRGPGIPESQLEAVLRPFYRVEGSRSRESGGHGLGLSIAATIAHAHGGTLQLKNRGGGGLEVAMVVPR